MEIPHPGAERPRTPKVFDKGNIRIRNMLASIERTFLPVGSNIGKYRIIEEIDRGGMAVVYKAMQLDLDREVALKVMPANITINRRFVERFLTEAHAVAKLSHSNIVSIHEVAVENNIYYIAMDYIPGKNLYYHLHYYKPKLVDVLEIIVRLAGALQYAHGQKIIHRDLKLNNVIMRDRLTPVLIDFGLAKAMESDDTSGGGITRTGEIMGSPSYMAPERMLGGVVDHRSDICSLGIMLYEMLTFKNPYLDQRNLHQTTMNVMEANPIPPRKLIPWLPIEIEAITLKAMAKDAVNRYQSMDALRADIVRYQKGEPVEAQPPSFWSKVKHYVKRHWAPLVIATIIVLFSTLLGVLMYLQSKKEQSHWQFIYTERFNSKIDTREWSFYPNASASGDTAWSIADGMLHCNAQGMAFAQLQHRFNRDMLIECDIAADTQDLHDVGIFLFGDTPDSGYRFYLNKGGTGRHGVSFPGSNFIFQDIDPARVSFGQNNHVVVERMLNSIMFTINGTMVARLWDFLPPLGKGHDHIGFFVNQSSARFDNLKIYRRAIPQVPSPTLIGNRFWERGDFEAALDEYRGLLVDFSDADMTKEIKIKMADCLIRLNRPEEALEVLRSAATMRNRDEGLTARMYFLQGIIYSRTGREQDADSVFKHLAIRFPTSPVNIAAMTSALVRSYHSIEQGNPQEAKREIVTMMEQYKRYPHRWGKLYLSLLKHYVDKGELDSGFVIAENISSEYEKDESIDVAAQIAEGTIYLHRGQVEKAKELFDRCITAHINVDGVWGAWMRLAEIYAYNFKYRDALTIYTKVHRESAPATDVCWMAAVAAAELYGAKNTARRDSLLHAVVYESHPFPVPRLIARYYLDQIRDSEFKKQWEQLFPGDRSYLLIFARKAVFNNEKVVAALYLNDLKRNLPVQRWNYFRVLKIRANLDRW